MPIIHANPEERRHGGWLARAEGRVKTRGVPIGPRPASLQRILDGPESAPSSSCGGAEDATDVRREVGSGRRNDARDVIAVKQVLHEAGLYTMPCPAVPSPIFDSEMRVAIRTFQGRHGLKEDGVIRPGDLLHKRLLDAVQIARCQALTAQLPELLIRNSAAHRKIEEAQDHLKVVDAEIKRLANQLRKFRLGHWVQWLLEATAESVGGLIARVIQELNPAAKINKRAIERIGSGIRSLKLEQEHWLKQRDVRNAVLNEVLKELSQLRAQQRRHGCPL